MVDIDIIKQLEIANDGQTIHLFYDDLVGIYLAFGLSAYYTTMVTEPYMSYSEDMQMPVALLRRNHVNALRQSLKRVEHTEREYYRFQLRQTVGEEGYAKWAQTMLEKHKSIYRNH